MKILLTGGCSAIGTALIERLSRLKEIEITFTWARSAEKAKVLTDAYPFLRAVQCDYTNRNQVGSLAESISQINPDVLIHTAWCGLFIDKHAQNSEIDEFRIGYNNNVIPVIVLTHEVIRHFRQKKKGKIITVTSSVIYDKHPVGSSMYCAEKAYIDQLSKSWAVENEKFNITANTISPSLMRTQFTACIDERVLDAIEEKNGRKFKTPADVAERIHFLLEAGEHVNGTDIPV